MYVKFYNLNAPKECVAAIDVMEFVSCQLLVLLCVQVMLDGSV